MWNQLNDDGAKFQDIEKTQQLEEKLKEFDQWRKEEVFDEVNDLGQTWRLLRWVRKREKESLPQRKKKH